MKRTGLSGTPVTLAATLALVMLAAQFLPAQTLTVLHAFTGGKDGSHPLAGLTRDASGSLYGTASKGGTTNNGAVFRLKHVGSGWTLSPLYNFAGGADGAYPVARVVFGPNGTLYGTTENGGTTGDCSGGCGTVFNLQPQPNACTSALCPWIETIVQRFTTLAFPASEVTFDSAGNLYGTTYSGGDLAPGGGNGCDPDCGAVYKLSPSNGSWTLQVLYSFYGPEDGDGQGPEAGVVFDNAGNLYGDTNIGGDCNFGILYQLTPGGSGWSEHILQQLCSTGSPASTLIFDGSSTFYGASVGNTPYGLQSPSVFSLTQSGGNWTFASIYTFNQSGGGPGGALLRDSAGNLYGTTGAGGSNPMGQCPSNGCGTIFELSPSGGGWTYTELYDFTGGNDGSAPDSNVVMDAAGNLYGTASQDGSNRLGTVWEFTP